MEKSDFKRLMKCKVGVMLILAEKALEKEDYEEVAHLAAVIREKIETLLRLNQK